MTSTLDYTVSGGYIELPVTTDPTELQSTALANIAAELPGWIPQEGHIEVILLEQFAAMVAESAVVASQVPEAIFSYFGTLVGITPIQGAAATAQTTWTMVDTQGYTIPAGTAVGYAVLGNQNYLFSTVDSFTVPSGSIATSPGAVLIQAQVDGSAYNNLAPQALSLVTSFSFVASIVSTTTSSGGADQETTAAYLNRLSNELQLLAPRPILPGDFAALSTSIDGVYRAAAFNGINPYANILVDQDAEFSVGLGTWVAGTNCHTLSIQTGSYGQDVIQMSSVASGSMSAHTGTYSVAQLQNYVVLVEMDDASTAQPNVQVEAVVYDVNSNVINSYISNNATDSTSRMTFVWAGFETPANAFTARVYVNVTATGSSEIHKISYAGLFAMPTPTNYVPDSSLLEVDFCQTWYGGTGTATTNPPAGFAVDAFETGSNGFVYTGTGSSSSTLRAVSMRTWLPAGNYIANGYVDSSNVTSGTPGIQVTNDSGTVLASASTTGTIPQTVTTGTFSGGAMVQFEFMTNSCTVSTGQELTFALPQIISSTGSAAYTQGPAWSPAGLQTNNERTVTVAAVDVDGNALSSTIEAELSSYL